MIPNWLRVQPGNTRLILSIPHAGTEIPEEYTPRLRSRWLARKDADWWLPQLYDFVRSLGVTVVSSRISRTVIDLNRDPSGVSLYPGQTTTGLCPTETFDGEPLYHPGAEPDAVEIAQRRARFHEPYHAALVAEIARLRALHPRVVLYDCHSIRSEVPRLFQNQLPNFNIGTNDGKSCEPAIADKVTAICAAATGFNYVVNGRFKGGYITRHYGAPARGVDAIQMELADRGYMVEPATLTPETWPPAYNEAIAAPLRAVLHTIIESLIP